MGGDSMDGAGTTDVSSVCRSGCMDRPNNRNRTAPNRLQPDRRLRLPGLLVGCGCRFTQLKKIKKPSKTGCNRLQPVFSIYYTYMYMLHILYLTLSKTN